MSDDILGYLITGVVTLIGAWLVYKGGKRTSETAKAATDGATRTDAQHSALEAWQHLLDPYISEVDRLRARITDEHNKRMEHEESTREALEIQRQQIDDLRQNLATWQRVAKTIARWATALRDEVLRLGGTVPATPDELLTLQALDDADDAGPHRHL